MTDTPTPTVGSEPVVVRDRVVYVGRRRVSSGKLLHAYADPQTLDTWAAFTKPLLTGHKPGAILEVASRAESPDHVIMGGVSAPTLVATYPDTEQILAWQVADRAVQTADDLRRRQARMVREQPDPLLDQLAPVRAELARLPMPQRRAAVAAILTYLLS